MKQRAKKGGVCWPSIWNLGCQTKIRKLSLALSVSSIAVSFAR